ncbi:hypothetical protein ORM30_18495 [Bacillus cereus]|nr:hypothetical protein [Bacillus cereus]
MLIKIDDTVTEFIKSNKSNLNRDSLEIRALNHIARAYQEGHHMISASLEALEVLAKLDLLDYDPQRIYHQLLSRFTFLLAYEDYCCSYILVKDNSFDFYRNESKPNKIIYEAPLKRFSKLSTLLPTILLSEDHSDCKFYEKIANKYILENKAAINVNLNLNHISGGGSQSYTAYDCEINKGSIVLAIADNDKSYPDDKDGETLAQLQKVYNKYNQIAIIELHGLKVREKENLIPPSMYLMCCNGSSKNVLRKLEEIERLSEHQSKLMYIDIKDGIKAKVVKDKLYKEYFQELFEVIDLIACSLDEVDQKSDTEVLMAGIGGKLDEFITDVFEGGLEKNLYEKKSIAQKENIPDYIIQKMEGDVLKKQNLVDSLPDYLKNEWDELCHKIISWGCCDNHIA